MNPPESEASAQLKEAPNYRKAAFEALNPGAHYAGLALKKPDKKRVPGDLIFVARPEGLELEQLIEDVLRIMTGDFKTLGLLATEAGMEFGSARRLKWSQFSDKSVAWECQGGRFEVEVTKTLREHLDSLPRNTEYVCSSLALIHSSQLQHTLIKICRALKTADVKKIRRFSLSRMMVSRYKELAAQGLRPVQSFSNAFRDPKARVRQSLLALLEESAEVLPHNGFHKSSPYREMKAEELKVLANSTKPEWALAVMVMFYLAMSANQLCRMTWERFDLQAGFAVCAGRQKVPLHPVLWQFLKDWPGQKSGKMVKYPSASQMITAAQSEFRKVGLTDPSLRLGSIRKYAFALLKASKLVLNAQGLVVLNSSFTEENVTEEARFRLLKKALFQFPDILNRSFNTNGMQTDV